MGSHVVEAVVKCTSKAGDPDEQTNRWVFSSDILLPTWSDIQGPLEAFYITHMTGSWAKELDSGVAPQVELYDISGHLDGSPHGPPISIHNMSVPLTCGADSLPGQIAVVVDYHADLSGIPEFGTGTRPRARRRGRHYHGPFHVTVSTTDGTTGESRWAGGFVANVAAGYSGVLAAVGVGLEWDVWSRKEAAVHPVIGGWVDNTPRTHRSRVEPSGIKSFWS